MTTQEINEKLEKGEILTLQLEKWDEIKADYQLIEEHDTHFAGMLLLVQSDMGLVAVEQPVAQDDKRMLRFIQTQEEATAFIKDRLDLYDRMWDGCGCKVDYSK